MLTQCLDPSTHNAKSPLISICLCGNIIFIVATGNLCCQERALVGRSLQVLSCISAVSLFVLSQERIGVKKPVSTSFVSLSSQ